jgi:hypothetical protein
MYDWNIAHRVFGLAVPPGCSGVACTSISTAGLLGNWQPFGQHTPVHDGRHLYILGIGQAE